MVTDTGGKKLCRDDVPVPSTVLGGMGQWDAWGSRSPEPLARKKMGMGTQDKSCFCHPCLDMPQQVLTPGHGFPGVGCGGKKHREPITAEMLWRTPLLSPCPQGLHAQGQMWDAHGYKAFPMATGSREPDFGSQSTNEQHGQMKGPTNLHLPDSFPLWGAGQERRLPTHGVLCLVPELKLNQVVTKASLKGGGWWDVGAAEQKGRHPEGEMQDGGCGEGLGHGMSSHL